MTTAFNTWNPWPSASVIKLDNQNQFSFLSIKISKPLPAQSTVSRTCHRSDAWSILELKVVSSAQIAISQITSLGRSLMYCEKSVGQRMKLEELQHSLDNFLEISHPGPLKVVYQTWNSARLKFVKKTSMSNPVKSLGNIKCYNLSSSRPVKSPSNSIRHHSEKICSWLRRPKNILKIREKATFL